METSDTDKEPAIVVREPDVAALPTLQDIQLMSKRRVLCLKPHLRLEWRGEDAHNHVVDPSSIAMPCRGKHLHQHSGDDPLTIIS
jgi:hypothetical protein